MTGKNDTALQEACELAAGLNAFMQRYAERPEHALALDKAIAALIDMAPEPFTPTPVFYH